MPKREPQSWEMVLKRNSVERLKHDLFPTELTGQWDRLVETSYEKLPEEDIVRLQWFGMYHDKPKIGTFMMRIKIPSGILSAEGLRAIGEISETYGRDQGELTTRQNIQLHYITLDKFPEILEKLKGCGLTTMALGVGRSTCPKPGRWMPASACRQSRCCPTRQCWRRGRG